MRNVRKLTVLALAAVGVLAFMSAPAWAGSGYEKVTTTFGSKGSGPGQFKEPTAIAVNDTTGDVYVVDHGNNRVEYFSASGGYIGAFAAPPGGFSSLEGIAVDNSGKTVAEDPSVGDVYVADAGKGVVDKFNATGKYEEQIGGPFSGKLNVATDSSGDLWVYEPGSAQVYEFEDTGTLINDIALKGRGSEETIPGFAVNSEGTIYATGGGGELYRFTQASGYEKETVKGNQTVSELATLAFISANNDLLVDEGSSIELFKSPVLEGAQPILTFPATGLSESEGIAVNGGEGEGTLYATQRTADDVDVFAAGAPEKPQIVSAKAKSINSEGGQFEVVVKPGDRKTSVTVEYSRHVSTNGEELEGAIETLNGSEVAAEFGEETSIVSGVEFPIPFATYYYRVTVTNSLGTVSSQIYAYTKLPVIAQEHVGEKTSATAMLEATLEPAFISTTYVFEYAETEAALNNGEGTVIHGATGLLQKEKLADLKTLEEKLEKEKQEEQEGKLPPGTVPPGSVPICPGIVEEGGTGTLPASGLRCPVSAEVSGLVPGRKYYYRVVAENEASEYTENANKGEPARSVIEELRPYAGPAATTGEAQNITATSATLSGEVNPEGVPTTYEFSYISEAGYVAAEQAGAANPYAEGETTETRTLPAGETPQAVGPVEAAGLLPATTYHYALVATNQFGIQAVGLDQTFTTAAAGPPPTPPSEGGGGLPGSGSPIAVPISPPPIAFAKVAFPKEEKSSGTTTKTLTNKEKLAKALKACKKDHSKSKKAKCEAAAHKKYPVASKKKGKKKKK